MINKIKEMAQALGPCLVGYRRDFHQYPELGWMEFRTASLVARRLQELGYTVSVGQDVLDPDSRMGLPSPEVSESAWRRAAMQNGDPFFLKLLKDGFTAVVGTLGQGDGPVIGLRFDMDALGIQENVADTHYPTQSGFASLNPGVMHACGHDGHTAIGLGIAEVLSNMQSELSGTVKLIFQPAEEGVRGAKAIVDAGIVDDVDYMLGLHLYSGWPLGLIDGGCRGFLATTKFDAVFSGEPAHAAASPQMGKNALLAAATAVLNLHAIPRHQQGATRINVGMLNAGSGRNIICSQAQLAIESRGVTTELNDYVYEQARRILETSAAMHGCSVAILPMGAAKDACSDAILSARVDKIAAALGDFSIKVQPDSGHGSEDFTFMMHRVQTCGGLASYIGLGAGAQRDWGGHHTTNFDFDEKALELGVALLSAVTFDLMHQG